MEYIHLIGAEQVQSAGVSMRSSADDMRRAASDMLEAARVLHIALDAHTIVMENYLLSRGKV